jgi:hypothetical protein
MCATRVTDHPVFCEMKSRVWGTPTCYLIGEGGGKILGCVCLCVWLRRVTKLMVGAHGKGNKLESFLFLFLFV